VHNIIQVWKNKASKSKDVFVLKQSSKSQSLKSYFKHWHYFFFFFFSIDVRLRHLEKGARLKVCFVSVVNQFLHDIKWLSYLNVYYGKKNPVLYFSSTLINLLSWMRKEDNQCIILPLIKIMLWFYKSSPIHLLWVNWHNNIA